jgi:hypothetical protein
MVKKKLNIDDDIGWFSNEMLNNFGPDIAATNWKGKNKWWYLSQLAKAVRELEDAMVKDESKKTSKNTIKAATKVANFSMIIADLHK